MNGHLPRFAARSITRRHMVAGSGLLGAGMLLLRTPARRTAAQAATIQAVASTVANLETLCVTFLGACRAVEAQAAVPLDVRDFLRVAQCQDLAHLHAFTELGAVASETSFEFAPSITTDVEAMLTALARLKGIMIAAHMAAGHALATADASDIAEIVYQIGITEARHEALALAANNQPLPSERAFAEWRFADPAEAFPAINEAGIILPGSAAIAFPGPVAIDCDGVRGLVPSNTDDESTPFALP